MTRPFRTPIVAVAVGAALTAAITGAVLAPPAVAAPPVDSVYLVMLKDGVHPRAAVDDTAAALTGEHGGDVRSTWRDALHGFSASMTAAEATALAGDPAVLSVEPDATVHATEVQPNPPSWGLDRIDQRLRPLDNTYNYPNNASPTWAYVIDTGIWTSHPEFIEPTGTNRAWIGYDAHGGNGQDCNGHGTHVAGTIGGRTVGVAKRTFLVGVRVLGCDGSGTYEQVINGVNWVTANAQRPAVANMSLGGPANSTLNAAVTNSINSGITYSVAAGNENQNACNVSPASVGPALTVSWSTITDAKAGFSNWGPCSDLWAPGDNIYSAWPGGGYHTISGTSMAAPHVAGVALMYLVWNTAATPAQVANVITSTATPNVISNPTGTPNRLLFNRGFGGPPANPPVGQVVSADGYGTIRGWARDPDGTANPCLVMFFVGGPMGTGTQIGQTLADLPGGVGGNTAFAFTIPDNLRDGQQRRIYVAAVEAGAGLTADIGSIDVTARRPITEADYDGDRKADVSIWRPSGGQWWIDGSTSGPYTVPFGAAADRPVTGDFDGDGRADVAVWRPSDGTWHVQRSTAGYLQLAFGTAGDVPVVGDYDGDRRSDIAVWRPSDGTWYVWPSAGSSWYGVAFGASGDKPVPGDYDSDGKADLAVFRPSAGVWIIQRSSDGQVRYEHWGIADDKLVPADYDGDGTTDLAVFRASTGVWHIRQSLTGRTRAVQWGLGSDVLTPADYDGDSRVDVATFRPDTGAWSILRGTTEDYRNFGGPSDVAIPGVNLANR